MRSLLITVLCLSMAVCILANDYILGERKTGDYSVRDNLIIKPPLDWMAFKATIGITCPTNEIITYVKITNRSDKKVNFQRLSGDIGIRTLVVMAKANKGEGLSLRVEVRCQLHPMKKSSKERINNAFSGNNNTGDKDDKIWLDKDNGRAEKGALL
ncbi:hypothetical protein EAI_16084 [Harpegnathos saltator]|uniref:MSP domain-containing protein n=1 Tax=Harpegnathos saltator TaxID=610380 RepID=E2B2H5_HARSA|nr:hypothetical protein EAI_16084 [Harpegnathos saltator]